MLYDNNRPRYLPHMDNPEVLLMGLSPMEPGAWIETDSEIHRYYQHKLQQRRLNAEAVYRASPASLPAQHELAQLLQNHLLKEQSGNYQLANGQLHCLPGNFTADLDAAEPLWNASLWVADDLVIMESVDDQYTLTAASLCSPSHWNLAEKFGRPLREIHDPIPDFHPALSDKIDRFFAHLRPSHPVVRFNWALQAGDALNQLPHQQPRVERETPLFYRCERQSLLRLPATGAIAFTIRVYLHRLELLADIEGALPTLFTAIESTPTALYQYKGFDELAPALEKYRPA
ncbi:heme-dependent oxidative N-demethylase family protein [Pseudohalioglobus lutimaris]|uniref:DUF3445 domain-containing protein n=1 Tax=Pseudohalioglobus lutimaris TaxID=1737061 RepID=A0A2N5X6R0_9GAMM|nr:DUF3445 domain-containing protein [Pseudohalioglobus lutimaris]PLW70169.1 DUF3445 domain-containing protein [Pseudohalioglobus lutimaris]